MRSQKEILDKIEELRKTQCDPMKVQRKHLIRKLSFENAKPYLRIEAITDIGVRERWKKSSRVDETLLREEIYNFLFNCYEFYLNRDSVACLTAAQYLLIWVWLLGPKWESLFRHVLHIFLNTNSNHCKPIFDLVTIELGWKVETFMRSWEDRPKLILPEDMTKKGSPLVEDINAISRIQEQEETN